MDIIAAYVAILTGMAYLASGSAAFSAMGVKRLPLKDRRTAARGCWLIYTIGLILYLAASALDSVAKASVSADPLHEIRIENIPSS